MKVIILATFFLASIATKASNISCSFLDMSPLLVIEIDLVKDKLSVFENNEVIDVEKLSTKYVSEMSVIVKGKKYVLTVDKTQKATDGSTDKIYEYRGTLTTRDYPFRFGGCESL